MIIILRKLYSMINESNICHLISGQHRQHITNYVILHVFQQQWYMISARSPRACKKSTTTSRCSIGRNDCKLYASMPPDFWEGDTESSHNNTAIPTSIKKGFSFFMDWSLSHQRTGKCIALCSQCFLLSILTFSLQFEVLTMRTLLFYYTHHSWVDHYKFCTLWKPNLIRL